MDFLIDKNGSYYYKYMVESLYLLSLSSSGNQLKYKFQLSAPDQIDVNESEFYVLQYSKLIIRNISNIDNVTDTKDLSNSYDFSNISQHNI